AAPGLPSVGQSHWQAAGRTASWRRGSTRNRRSEQSDGVVDPEAMAHQRLADQRQLTFVVGRRRIGRLAGEELPGRKASPLDRIVVVMGGHEGLDGKSGVQIFVLVLGR